MLGGGVSGFDGLNISEWAHIANEMIALSENISLLFGVRAMRGGI